MHCQSQGHTTEDKARHVVEDEVEEKRKEKVQRQLNFFGGDSVEPPLRWHFE